MDFLQNTEQNRPPSPADLIGQRQFTDEMLPNSRAQTPCFRAATPDVRSAGAAGLRSRDSESWEFLDQSVVGVVPEQKEALDLTVALDLTIKSKEMRSQFQAESRDSARSGVPNPQNEQLTAEHLDAYNYILKFSSATGARKIYSPSDKCLVVILEDGQVPPFRKDNVKS